MLHEEVSGTQAQIEEFKHKAQFYAKHNCKRCLGRGYQEYTMPARIQSCPCALRNLARTIK